MEQSILDKVAEIVKLYYRPATVNEIAEAAMLTKASTLLALRELTGRGIVENIGDSGRNYYRYCSEKKTVQEDGIDQKYIKANDALTEKAEMFDKRIEEVEKQTRHIYVNLISIMGVFVAIFSLIIINTNAITRTISRDEEIGSILLKLTVFNLPVVICIIALLLGIRFIILRDFKKR